ncbi:hypothetical protein ACFV23_01380 [Streptomyces sp. NPDC059627]
MINPMDIDLLDFLNRWYGAPTQAVTPLPPACHWLPAPLRAWYEASSQWDRPLMTIKEMNAPEEIASLDKKAIFMTDPGDAIWAFDVEDPSIVWEGQMHEGWTQSAERLPEFLVHNALNEAAFNAAVRRSWDQVEVSRLEEILAPMTEVSFGGWLWPRPGHKIYLGEGLLADVGPAVADRAPWGDKPGFADVQIGSVDSDRLSYIDSIPNIDWIKAART